MWVVSPRESRLTRNQELFQAVNGQIAELVDRWDGHELQIICECGNTGCSEMLRVPVMEYVRVRECPGWFLITPGHTLPDAEHVVEH